MKPGIVFIEILLEGNICTSAFYDEDEEDEEIDSEVGAGSGMVAGSDALRLPIWE